MKNVNSIAIVGAGTAGLVSALILKTRFPDMKIDIICSKDIGIVGVGEGSTEHWKTFMQFVGIDSKDLIQRADATFKLGVMFQNWVEDDYLHSIGLPFAESIGEFSYVFAKHIAKHSKSSSMSSPLIWDNKLIDDSYAINSSNQYHFNTFKLNEYLSERANNLNINIIDDIIQDVSLDADGNIKMIHGAATTYNYDFYIDSTGFKRVLIDKLGAKWQSFGKYLKMKSAITFPTEDTENYNLWTLARAMNNGWLFRIPVWGRHGNGYIFDSDYMTAEEAKLEVEKYLGHSINVGRTFNFDPGCLDKFWINNCCAIGLSSIFVEPLEASSIGTSIHQTFLLMHKLVNYNQSNINNYNSSVTSMIENIRDFIFLHYMIKRDDTKFWRDIQNLEPPESLKKKLDIWKNKLPVREDFNNSSGYLLFNAQHYIMILAGLGLFDRESIKKEYDSIPPHFKEDADKKIKDFSDYINNNPTITHKKFLERVRSER